jgi:hypothetical protein
MGQEPGLFDAGGEPLAEPERTVYCYRKTCACRAVALTVSNKWLIHLMALNVVVRLFAEDPPRCTQCQRLWEREGMEAL